MLTNILKPWGPFRGLHSRLLHKYNCSPGWGNSHPYRGNEKTRLCWGPENDPDVLRMGTGRSDGMKKNCCPMISDPILNPQGCVWRNWLYSLYLEMENVSLSQLASWLTSMLDLFFFFHIFIGYFSFLFFFFFFSFSTLLETHNSTKQLQIFPSLDSITKTSAKFPSSDSTEPSNYLLFIVPPLLAPFSFRWSHASFCFFCHLLSVSCIFHLASVPAKV